LACEHLDDKKAAHVHFLKDAMFDPTWAAPEGELARVVER
jgi:hypothetical protein